MNLRTKHLLPLAVLMTGAAAYGETASSTIELDGIEEIYLMGPHSLVVTQGEREQVTVTTDRKYLDQVEARIKGNVLALGEQRRSFWSWLGSSPDWRAEFAVTVSNLQSISNQGSGSVEIRPFSTMGELALNNQGSGDIRSDSLDVRELDLRGMGSGDLELGDTRAPRVQIKGMGSGDTRVRRLQADAVSINLLGSGDLEIGAGSSDQLDVTVTGSGDVDSSDFHSERVTVKILGSGEVEVYAGQQLEASVTGSGDLHYHGQPASVEKSITGSGDIEPRN